MEKEKILEILEKFEKIIAERNKAKSNLHMSLEITCFYNGSYTHSCCAIDRENSGYVGFSLKGFPDMVDYPKVKTFDDVLKLLKEVQNG